MDFSKHFIVIYYYIIPFKSTNLPALTEDVKNSVLSHLSSEGHDILAKFCDKQLTKLLDKLVKCFFFVVVPHSYMFRDSGLACLCKNENCHHPTTCSVMSVYHCMTQA